VVPVLEENFGVKKSGEAAGNVGNLWDQRGGGGGGEVWRGGHVNENSGKPNLLLNSGLKKIGLSGGKVGGVGV